VEVIKGDPPPETVRAKIAHAEQFVIRAKQPPILRLPDEITLIIFDHLDNNASADIYERQLSHTCRRFRRVIPNLSEAEFNSFSHDWIPPQERLAVWKHVLKQGLTKGHPFLIDYDGHPADEWPIYNQCESCGKVMRSQQSYKPPN
jgi:hypothetical protein